LKQVIAGFSYHFWSKAMPKLQKYKSNEANQAKLESIDNDQQRKLITGTVRAIEGFVQLSAIALGFLQFIGLMFSHEINNGRVRFMRTISNTTPSERTVADFLRKNIYRLFILFPRIALTTIISSKQIPISDDFKDSAA